ncbi:TetR/AcrR family transcriptional regulator [Roseibium aggregatum]|uniref:TetR/AcrR family transcriptional regulator n=1 Tax=Roseibium aggregatum TaxID=187304 RepID=A0A926S578_9HYPH|nr:TetR/AcrR family transcriptional regulator [Roseibium aggregatum]MBD1545152.1 TetR/AcrR family transcriptional regulator [Roseibium aggregatum]
MTSSSEPKNKRKAVARTKLLEAALSVIRAQGYAATSVDDLCRAAGVTKGAFFHHFKTKDDLAVAAADYWSQVTGALFKGAPYHDHEDPLDRLLGYLDFRKALIAGSVPEFTCLVGTMTQEVYDTSPAIREACADSICGHADTLVADIAAAAERHRITLPCSAESLALHTQAVIQGGFIVAKARNEPQQAIDSIDHLTRYVRLLFNLPA